jgi:predicted DNA-binding transcriptional regulator AlpA
MRADQVADIYLSEAEFSDRYLVSSRTAQRWRYEGTGGPKWVRLGLRRVAYRLSDCEEWAAARTFNSRAHELSVKGAVA